MIPFNKDEKNDKKKERRDTTLEIHIENAIRRLDDLEMYNTRKIHGRREEI